MPKARTKRDAPILRYIEKRREGSRMSLGDTDRLYHSLGQGLVADRIKNTDEWHSSPRFSSHPYYVNPDEPRNEANNAFAAPQDAHPYGSTGGIFNLEFSPDGKILSAACEMRNILIFDPLTREVVHNLTNAHQDCVNCVRFLDTRTFATCSDDTEVALWDIRNLKNRVRTLQGHSNWVKNIEFSHKNNLLVTSGFDGAIFTWDINRYSESNLQFEKVFYTNGLMRMRLTPDASKMVISTLYGFLVVIHDLDLTTLSKDLQGFKPNMYRLMQMSGRTMDIAVNYTKLFHAKRNRVELISDFAAGNDAEIISSLRLHPQGWVVVSRNTSSNENSEWCCVHDIQDVDTREEDDVELKDIRPLMYRRIQNPNTVPLDPPSLGQPGVQSFQSGRIQIISSGAPPVQAQNVEPEEDSSDTEADDDDDDNDGGDRDRSTNRSVQGTEDRVDGHLFLAASSFRTLGFLGDLRERVEEMRQSNAAQSSSSSGQPGPAQASQPQSQESDSRVRPRSSRPDSQANSSSFNRAVGTSPNQPQSSSDNRSENNLEISIDSEDSDEAPEADDGENFIVPRQRRYTDQSMVVIGGTAARRILYFGAPGTGRPFQRVPKTARIHHNIPRLTHYIEESNTGRGYIKEQAFSPCGRFIASPFGFGIRLLAWDSQCRDLSDCAPTSPVQLYEVGTKVAHTEDVLSSAFSPTNWLLVSGCRAGKVIWHQPAV